MFGKKEKPYNIAEQLDPGKSSGLDLDSGSFWDKRRIQSQPIVIVSPDAAITKTYTMYAEDAWQINFEWSPNRANSICLLKFTNGETLDLNDFSIINGALGELILKGQPYVKRSDIVECTVTDGTLLIIRDIVTMNVEKSGR